MVLVRRVEVRGGKNLTRRIDLERAVETRNVQALLASNSSVISLARR